MFTFFIKKIPLSQPDRRFVQNKYRNKYKKEISEGLKVFACEASNLIWNPSECVSLNTKRLGKQKKNWYDSKVKFFYKVHLKAIAAINLA